MRADGSGQRRLTNAIGYDGGPFFSPDGSRIIWRRFDEQGLIADVWTMKLDGTDQRQITELRLDELGAVHPSVRRSTSLFASNKLGFENFEVFMVDIDGQEGAGPRHLLRRLRRPARAVARRPAAGVDVEPRRRPRGTALPRRLEPRDARLPRCKAVAAAERRRTCDRHHAVHCQRRSAARGSRRRQRRAVASTTQGARRVPGVDELEGREAGSERRAARRRLHRGAARAHRRAAAAGPQRHVHAVRVHRRQPRRRLASHRSADASFTGCHRSARSRFPTTREVTGPVVFAGYGIVVPEAQNFGYDSYATLDVKDKIVVVLRYFPGGCRSADARDPRALLRSALQGDGGARSAAPGRCSSSPVRAHRMPASSCR